MNACMQANTVLSLQQHNRLKQMGATVRNATAYLKKLQMEEEKVKMAEFIIGKMSIEQLSEMISFYHKMGQLCSEALDRKQNALTTS